MVEALPRLLEQAKRENATLLALVGKLADAEKSSRIKSAVTRRIRDARFPRSTPSMVSTSTSTRCGAS